MDHTVIWTFCSRSIAEVLQSTQVILIPDARQPNGCWTLLQLPHHSSKTTCVFRDKNADDQKGPAPWIMQTSREVDQSIQSLQFSAAEAGSTDQQFSIASVSVFSIDASLPTSLRRLGLGVQ